MSRSISETASEALGTDQNSTDNILWYGIYALSMATLFIILEAIVDNAQWLSFYREGT